MLPPTLVFTGMESEQRFGLTLREMGMNDTRDIIERFLKYTEDRDFDGHREILAED